MRSIPERGGVDKAYGEMTFGSLLNESMLITQIFSRRRGGPCLANRRLLWRYGTGLLSATETT